MMAIGFIETKGLVSAIEAADAMLKAAEVRLLEKNLVGGGLVTITVCGEVAAVQSSVDAATASIGRIAGATLVSRHVIPRPDMEVSHIIATTPPAETGAGVEHSGVTEKTDRAEAGQVNPAPAEEPAPQTQEKKPQPEAKISPPGSPKTSPAGVDLGNPVQLKKMSLTKLRQLAHSLDALALSREEIDSASKNELAQAITQAYRQTKE